MLRKRWLLALLLTALLAAIAVPVASAGVLTSASYTYLFKGREVEMSVDILTVQGATMAPEELLNVFGLKPVVDGDAIRLERGPVTIAMALGSDVAKVNGKAQLMKTGPMRASGRLFIPAEVLPELGISLTVDGKFVLLADYMASYTGVGGFDLKGYTLDATVRDGVNLMGLRIIALSPENLDNPDLAIPWGTRLKLRALLETRTLLLVTLKNQSLKAITFDPAKMMLIGEGGRQFDYLKQEIAVDGTVTGSVAPGAVRTSVLAYTKVEGATFDLYHDGAQSVLGRLPAR